MIGSDWTVRSITESEIDEFRERVSQGFGRDPSDKPEARERFTRIFDLDRTFAVFDNDVMVGTGAAFTFDLTVPGGALPMGGTTVITVRPTHRRSGVLNAMMRFHLAEVMGRGEPIAGLWASEGGIYSRFGYGIATTKRDATVSSSNAVFSKAPVSSVVELLTEDDARPHLVDVFDQLGESLPGMFTRNEDWWRSRVLVEETAAQGDLSQRRYAVAFTGGLATGYAIYRQKLDWSDGTPKGEISVTELLATSGEARRALWNFLTNVDLFQTVKWWNMPVDDPVTAMVDNPRSISGDVGDALWIRLLDIPTALTRRIYESDGSIDIGVTDGFLPDNSGTYRLEVFNGKASCVRTADRADLSCDVDVLGHLYLGGGSALTMAEAGRLEGDVSKIRLLDHMFRTAAAPWCPEVF